MEVLEQLKRENKALKKENDELKKRLESNEKPMESHPQFNRIKDYWNWVNEVEKEMR